MPEKDTLGGINTKRLPGRAASLRCWEKRSYFLKEAMALASSSFTSKTV
jgi:hypothetical protein